MPTDRNASSEIYVWCYPDGGKNFPGWHLTADEVSCARLIAEITELMRAVKSVSPGFKVSPVTRAVLAVPNNRKAAARSAVSVRIARVAESPQHFELVEETHALTVRAGDASLEQLRARIAGIPRGEGDSNMRPGGKRPPADQTLWFWWMPRR